MALKDNDENLEPALKKLSGFHDLIYLRYTIESGPSHLGVFHHRIVPKERATRCICLICQWYTGNARNDDDETRTCAQDAVAVRNLPLPDYQSLVDLWKEERKKRGYE